MNPHIHRAPEGECLRVTTGPDQAWSQGRAPKLLSSQYNCLQEKPNEMLSLSWNKRHGAEMDLHFSEPFLLDGRVAQLYRGLKKHTRLPLVSSLSKYRRWSAKDRMWQQQWWVWKVDSCPPRQHSFNKHSVSSSYVPATLLNVGH